MIFSKLFYVLLCLIAGIILFIIFLKHFQKVFDECYRETIKASKKEYSDDTLVICCICMGFTLYFGYELAKWLTSPQISALQYFVNEMR